MVSSGVYLTIGFLSQIQDIIRMSHLLTIFRVNEDTSGDVDVAILQALLKGNYKCLTGQYGREEQH